MILRGHLGRTVCAPRMGMRMTRMESRWARANDRHINARQALALFLSMIGATDSGKVEPQTVCCQLPFRLNWQMGACV